MAIMLGAGYLYSAYEIGLLLEKYPPQGEFVHIDGTTIHYVDSGDGPPIVWLHGASSSLGDFEASIAPPLRKRHGVISVYRPGYGFSTRRRGRWVDPAENIGNSNRVSAILRKYRERPDRGAGRRN